ncbi:DnaJ domain-containing protein [Cynara cardunculus var. scolymus]|uniref:DnaJ domain-containing protein n=1 Tax=Cynara cardunculus var. scolymus TaxID=59895 RepID=A0A118JVJ0_CYNCS|nr:DnaJ domain-containing protein [Cynara cardunculus var. scolymus]
MDEFGMLAKDFGFRPQGKSAPMKSEGSRPPFSSSTIAEEDHMFSDVFGGTPKNTNNSKSTSAMADFDYDAIFKNSTSSNNDEAKSKATSLNLPVYDKPVYDDDIFDGLPGLKSKSMSSSASPRYEDNIFASMTTSPPKRSQQSDHFDDLMGSLGRTEKVESTRHHRTKSPRGFDDLIPGFGSGNPATSNRLNSEPTPKSTANTKEASNAVDDLFVGLESTSTTANSYQSFSTDPPEEIGSVSKSRIRKNRVSSKNGSMFDDIDPLNGFGKSAPIFTNEMNNRGKDKSPSKEGSATDSAQSSISKDSTQKASFRYSESRSQEMPIDDFQESHQTVFDIPAIPTNHHRSFDQSTSPPYMETSSQMGMSPTSEPVQQADDVWLSVSEIPLFTQPTRAPPPSRPPPPIPRHILKPERGSLGSNSRNFVNDSSSSPNFAKNSRSPRPFQPVARSSLSSPLDDLENFATGMMPNNGDDHADAQSGEEMDSILAAAAMKEAMDRAEAKFRHAKEVREREHAKAFRNKESVQPDKDEQGIEEGLRRDRLDRERKQREKEEEEREHRQLEKDRMGEIERQKARQAVERATREARERAALEARERASVEARLKSERAAVQRAQAEARERAAVGAKERAERATMEAREKEAQEKAAVARAEEEARRRAEQSVARAEEESRRRAERAVAQAEEESRRRAERSAVERVAAEARKRAAAEARERAAASRMNQQKNDNDLESFFGTASRPSSAPKPRETSSDSAADLLSQNRRGSEGAHRASTAGVSSNMRKASSTTNIVDDLSSIFGAATAAQFQEVVGETEERRRARLEREQRTQERAAKALAEKNQRDLQSQREQEERHRIAGTLDTEIKRWAAGKEGNLRVLLSTLQYVLWPECGWQPVSLTDLITGANVKKAYRKATLCIHPDKVQQKGANLQQKYVAEKEAWNKFNSEELF